MKKKPTPRPPPTTARALPPAAATGGAPPALAPTPSGYPQWLGELKDRIRTAQLRASLAVNRELVCLYWQIGRDILVRQTREGWGARVIDRLAHDLQTAFPEMKGFSSRNLSYMRSFAEAWPDAEIVQQVAARLPWFHLCTLLDKLRTQEERVWCLAKAVEHGWSRSVLTMQIETHALERSGRAMSSRLVIPAPCLPWPPNASRHLSVTCRPTPGVPPRPGSAGRRYRYGSRSSGGT